MTKVSDSATCRPGGIRPVDAFPRREDAAMTDPAHPARSARVKVAGSRDDFVLWERELNNCRLRAMFRDLLAHAYQGLISYGAQAFPQSLAYRLPVGGRGVRETD
jgi:hypothetical protein